jgi:acetyl-CoA decarbonylase/synthase complex subunit alpha
MYGITALRDWDFLLLKRYPPQYFKKEDECSLCTYGPCKIDEKKKGVCGIGLNAHLSRMSLFTAVTGAAGHVSLAETLTTDFIEKFGKDYPLILANGEPAQTPLIRLICGFKPKVLSDLKKATAYLTREITHLLSTMNMGQEGEWIDFESKTLHAGMIDNLALEVSDIAQIVTLKFPSNSPDTPLQNSEFRIQNSEFRKPAILCIGHNSLTGTEVMEYIHENNLSDKIEIYGLCCMASDMSRKDHHGMRIVGNQSDQLKFVRSGIADVIILDSQCIRTDILHHAAKMGIAVIATSQECCLGLIDRTGDKAEDIIDDLIQNREAGVLIFDKKKIAQVAAETVLKGASLPLQVISRGGKRQGNNPLNSPLLRGTEGVVSKIRVGRGAISDLEIKNIAPPIIMGEIPGIIGLFGCPNYSTPHSSPPYKGGGILEMARALIDRNYIVTSGGCVAIDLAKSDKDGKFLYEETTGIFDGGGFANLGSCVSASHLLGAAIKIASVMLKRSIDGNYEEIADYIFNRVGVIIIIWGPMSQKAFATATGANRLGIPVIFGSKGERYGRLMKGDMDGSWEVIDRRSKKTVFAGPTPAHLLTIADKPSEAAALAAKLCMRPNDTSKGRQIKLKNYIELHKLYSDDMFPEDIHLFIRTAYDIPDEHRNDIRLRLENVNWKPVYIPDPTILMREPH